MVAGKRYAVLQCAEDSVYVKKMYGGYFDVFRKMLAEEGERWDVYRVACGEFPSEVEVESCDGFVITGSCYDAHGNDVWIRNLLSLLKRLDFMKKKVLGICFGHQILGLALGGKVGRNELGWDIGVRTVNLSSSSKIFSSLQVPARLPLIECHRDAIGELPSKAEVIGWSDKTGIEMFRYGDHFMGIQGHPEYDKHILLHLIDRLLKDKYIKDSIANEAKKNVEEQELNREAWKKLCVSFLKGRL